MIFYGPLRPILASVQKAAHFLEHPQEFSSVQGVIGGWASDFVTQSAQRWQALLVAKHTSCVPQTITRTIL
jgi:hypothetical protein